MECITTRIGLLVLISALSACASKNQAPLSSQSDFGGTLAGRAAKPHFEPVPYALPPSKGGNPESYEVFGETYQVMASSAGYREQGVASWYGPGFHGELTSSRETYDMNGMTAAHKSLPIPTFVRVTHLENGRSVVVKVNDRGPFADDRIIDLSRAAAQALDVISAGTAPVDVVALKPYQTLPGRGITVAASGPTERESAPFTDSALEPPPPTTAAFKGEVLQLAAFSSQANAIELVEILMTVMDTPLWVDTGTNFHRVRTGPVTRADQIASITSLLSQMGMGPPHVVRR